MYTLSIQKISILISEFWRNSEVRRVLILFSITIAGILMAIVISINIVLTLFSLIALWILVQPVIKYFYDKKFELVIFINFIGIIDVRLYGNAVTSLME